MTNILLVGGVIPKSRLERWRGGALRLFHRCLQAHSVLGIRMSNTVTPCGSWVALPALAFEAGLLTWREYKGVKKGCAAHPPAGFLDFVLAPLQVCPGSCRERFREVGTLPPWEHTCCPMARYAVLCKPPTLALDSGFPLL